MAGNEDAFEASAIGYYARQFRATQYNFGLVEVQAGPRFSLPAKGQSVKVYAIGGFATLSDSPYFEAAGAGAIPGPSGTRSGRLSGPDSTR